METDNIGPIALTIIIILTVVLYFYVFGMHDDPPSKDIKKNTDTPASEEAPGMLSTPEDTKEKSQKFSPVIPILIGIVVAAVFCGVLKGIGYPIGGLFALLMNVACVLAAFSIMIGYKRRSPFHKFVFKLTICLIILGATILLLGACGIFLTGMTTFLLCLIMVTAMYLISLKS